MATILRTPALFLHPPAEVAARAALPAAPRGPPYICARRRISWSLKLQLSPVAYRRLCFPKFKIFAAYGDTTEAEEIAEDVEKVSSMCFRSSLFWCRGTISFRIRAFIDYYHSEWNGFGWLIGFLCVYLVIALEILLLVSDLTDPP